MRETRRSDLSGRHVVRGALVSLGGSLGSRILSFAALAVLARMLLPSDFGIMATAMIFIGLCRALMNRQFHLALIRLPRIEPSHLDTAFTLSMIWGLVSGLLLFAGAHPLAEMMGVPEIGPVLQLMALSLPLEGLTSPAFAQFERNLNLRPDVLSDWVGKIGQYVVSIGLALWWQSHWVLVLGFLAFTVLRVGLSYVFAPYRPRLDFTHTATFLSFGGWLSATGLAGYASSFTDVTLVAVQLGTAAVGLYNLAAEIVRMTSDYLAMPLGRAVYPGLAGVVHDPIRLRQSYFDALSVLAGLMLPIGVGLSLVAPEAVALVLGNKWGGTVPIIRILAPAAAFSTLSYAAQSVVMAEGRTRAMFGRNLGVALAQLPLIWAGIALAGIVGAAAGRAVGMILQGFLSLVISAPIARVSVAELLLAFHRSMIACAVMAIVVAGLLPQVLPSLTFIDGAADASKLSALLALALKAATGAAVYVATHLGLWQVAGRPRGFEQIIMVRLLPALRRG